MKKRKTRQRGNGGPFKTADEVHQSFDNLRTDGTPLPQSDGAKLTFEAADDAQRFHAACKTAGQASEIHGFVYGLPDAIYDSLLAIVGGDCIEEPEMQFEQELINQLEGRSAIGKWGANTIYCDLLGPPMIFDHTAMQADAFGMSPEQLRWQIGIANKRLKIIEATRAGFAGWLMANGEFLDEHDQLLCRYRERFLVDGFPRPWQHPSDRTSERQFVRLVPKLSVDQSNPPNAFVFEDDAWIAAYRAFCERWRLDDLAGPFLPEPMVPHLPWDDGAAGLSVVPGQVTFVIADIFPMGGNGFIGEVIDDVLRGGHRADQQHLRGWLKIVGKSSFAKNQIPRYVRVFRLQHYWRIICQRHDSRLKRRQVPLQRAFATYFNVDGATIKRDLGLLRRQLGKDWATRPDPLARR